MNLQRVYGWSKRVHKWLMWGTILFGGWMMASGWLMHRQLDGEWIPVGTRQMIGVREWHDNISQWFLVVLLGQMLTGLIIWGVPKLIQRSRSERS